MRLSPKGKPIEPPPKRERGAKPCGVEAGAERSVALKRHGGKPAHFLVGASPQQGKKCAGVASRSEKQAKKSTLRTYGESGNTEKRLQGSMREKG